MNIEPVRHEIKTLSGKEYSTPIYITESEEKIYQTHIDAMKEAKVDWECRARIINSMLGINTDPNLFNPAMRFMQYERLCAKIHDSLQELQSKKYGTKK